MRQSPDSNITENPEIEQQPESPLRKFFFVTTREFKSNLEDGKLIAPLSKVNIY